MPATPVFLRQAPRVKHPEPKELETILALATELNRSDARELHLVSDLTSIVQLGDILRIRWDESGVYLRLQEIKRGKVNDALIDLLDANAGQLPAEDLAEVVSTLGPLAKEQAERMARQRARFGRFTALAESDRAEKSDHPDLRRLAATKPPAMATYLHLLPGVVADAKINSLAFHCIDDCLWLIGVSEAGVEELGNARNLQHRLFHAKRPQVACEISEIDALNREAPLVNLAAHNLVHVLSRPPLAWYPKDLVLDVVMDRVRIYAQFDLETLFKQAKPAGLQLSLITGREAEEAKKNRTSSPMLEDRKAYGVKVEFPGGRAVKLRSSLFRSVYSDLVRPTAILSLLTAMHRGLTHTEASQP